MISLPLPNEYNEFYLGYVNSIQEEDVLVCLKKQLKAIPDLLWQIPEAKQNYAYADGKWTVKQVVQHINDVERVFTFRALSFARGDKQDMPGMDQDVYMANIDASKRDFSKMIDEFVSLRVATICLFEDLTHEQLTVFGTASGFPVSVRALAALTAGHAQHHTNILKERYLS